MKKICALITVLCVILSYGSSWASPITDISDDACMDAVEMLSAYDIMSGYPDNTFKPSKYITRAEMAKIITVVAGYSEYSDNMTSLYEDMHGHWAEQYVEMARALNIIRGTSARTYSPDNNINYNEAITMILRLLGYTDESLGGLWPTNYYEMSETIGLFENTYRTTAYVTRRDIAIMIYNALSCDIVSSDGNNYAVSGKKLLSLIGSMTTETITEDYLDSDNGFNYTDYMFNTWDVYYDKVGKPVLLKNPRATYFTGTVTSLLSNNVVFVTDSSSNVRAFKIADIPVVLNGSRGSSDYLENADVRIVCIDNSDNSEVLGIIAYKCTDTRVIDSSNIYTDGSRTFAGRSLPLTDGHAALGRVYVYGDASSIYDIQVDDVVYFYDNPVTSMASSSMTLNVVRRSMSGTVSNVETHNSIIYYTIDQETYKTGSAFVFTENASIKDEVSLVLDRNGDIAKLYIIKYGKVPGTFGIVMSASSGVNNHATARIMDQNGSIKTYSLAPNSSVVSVSAGDGNTYYNTYLKRNDIVKFDPVEQGVTLKVIDKLNQTVLSGYYNSETYNIGTNYCRVTFDTFIVYESAGKYSILNPNQLDTYLKGYRVMNSDGTVAALYLSKGLKANAPVVDNPVTTPLAPDASTFNDIVGQVTKNDDGSFSVQLMLSGVTYTVSDGSSAYSSIRSYQNAYAQVTVSEGSITSVTKLSAETEKTRLTAVYTGQLQIDGITYMEYADNARIIICSQDSYGTITSAQYGSLTDLKEGLTVQLYDIDGKYDSKIDVIMIFK